MHVGVRMCLWVGGWVGEGEDGSAWKCIQGFTHIQILGWFHLPITSCTVERPQIQQNQCNQLGSEI